MARLNDESQSIPEGKRHPSDQILSPQPCVPPNKEHILASFETSHLQDNTERVTDDEQMSRDYEYPSSSSSTRHSSSDIFGRDVDDDLNHMKSRASSRSSFSSIPASVLVHPLEKINSMRSMNPHEKMAAYTIEDDEAQFGGFEDPPKNMNIRTIRQREAAFRKPSSVRAMQMHTEDEADDDEYLTPPRRRGGIRSPGSGSGSSPLKRSPYYSPTTSSNKLPKPKKEYPLVLLHCNLLAPSLPVPGATLPQNQSILEETLPAEYWRRWRRLQEKVGSGVLRDRGVLISHPEDLYDMLEERLLESLELQRSRLHQGHFLGHEESGPGSEAEFSDREESETDGEQGDECPDCGGRVQRHSDSNRKWEIRVYAANGLMRAGAWAAAWKEMEKVDVEVGLWLPSDVRRALAKRLADEQTTLKVDLGPNQTQSDIDYRRASVQSHSRASVDPRSFQAIPQSSVEVKAEQHVQEPQPETKQFGRTKETGQPQIALHILLFNYVRILASDRRNIALFLMSIVVVFLAIGTHPQQNQPVIPVFPNSAGFDHLPSASTQPENIPTAIVPEPQVFASSPATLVPPSEEMTSSVEASVPSSSVSVSTAESTIPSAEVLASSVAISVPQPEPTVSSPEIASPSSAEESPSSSLTDEEVVPVEPEHNISEGKIQPTEVASNLPAEEDLSTPERRNEDVLSEPEAEFPEATLTISDADKTPIPPLSSSEDEAMLSKSMAAPTLPEDAEAESIEAQNESPPEVQVDTEQIEA